MYNGSGSYAKIGRKPKVSTFSFPNWVKNSDQILYRKLFITKSIYNQDQRSFLGARPIDMIATTSKTTIAPSANPTGIQRGAVTHHQDQLMTWVSLSTRNVKNKRLQKLVPPTVTDDFGFLIYISPFEGFIFYYTTKGWFSKEPTLCFSSYIRFRDPLCSQSTARRSASPSPFQPLSCWLGPDWIWRA